MAAATENWRCNISKDSKTATLFIEPPADGASYTIDDVTAYLRQNGVVNGIVYSELEMMLTTGIYYKDVIVAKGTEPVNGSNGYYEFFFDQGKIKHPTIRSDGSVDYQSMSIIHSVVADEVLAIYHKAIPGKHGMDVKGRELRCKPGKELPELKGYGFSFKETPGDTVTYVSDIEGRVEYDHYKLFIRDVYEVHGDLDLITGRIDFRGDVIVHGNVRTGTTIRASKSITIEGNVEAAVLIAEGDIILKKGMQGGKRARVVSGGNVYAYFLEYTEVSARGNVEANIILNCKVTAGKSIIVKGRKGYVVGGQYEAVNLIDSTNIGNAAMVKTNVAVGISEELNIRNHLLNTKLYGVKKSIESAKQDIESINDIRITDEPKDVRDAKTNQIKRRLRRDERLLEHIEKELEQIRSTIENGKSARIDAEGKTFPGVQIKIDDKELNVTKEYECVEFYRSKENDDIATRNIPKQ